MSPSSLPRVETFTSLPSSEVASATTRELENEVRVDPATGELLEHDCPSCNRLAARVAGLETDLDATQDKLTQALTQIKALKTQDENRRLRHKHRPRVEAIFRDWQEVCDKPRSKLTNDRHDAINAALNLDYDEEVFHLAALGARHNNPWRVKDGQQPVTEIAVYAKGSWIEQFANAGAQWLAGKNVPEPEPPKAAPPPVSRRPEYGRRPIDRVLDALGDFREAQGQGEAWSARCPAHDDKNPSLSIRVESGLNGEIVLLNCFAGCDTADVVAALGLGMSDLFAGSVELEASGERARSRPLVADARLRRQMERLLEREAA